MLESRAQPLATDHQIDMSQHSETLQTSERQTPTVNLNYILWNHGSMENVSKVLDAVAETDLILLEVAGGSPELRKADEQFANHVMKTGEGLDVLDKLPPSPTLSITKALAGTGKELHFIDFSDENTDIAALYQEQEKEASQLDQLFCNVESDEVALQLERTIKVDAEFTKRRDALMRQQIEQRIGELTQDTDVAVLVGAAHSSISHSLMETPSQRVKVERTWLPGEELARPVRFQFDRNSDLVRQLNLGHSKPTPETFKKTVAEYYLDAFMHARPDTKASFTPEEGSWQGLLSSIDECCKKPLTRDQKWQHIKQIIGSSPYVNISTQDNPSDGLT